MQVFISSLYSALSLSSHSFYLLSFYLFIFSLIVYYYFFFFHYCRMAAWVLGALNTPFGSDSDGGSRGFDLASLPETSLIRSLLSHLLVPKGNLLTSPHAPPLTQRASLDYLCFIVFFFIFLIMMQINQQDRWLLFCKFLRSAMWTACPSYSGAQSSRI